MTGRPRRGRIVNDRRAAAGGRKAAACPVCGAQPGWPCVSVNRSVAGLRKPIKRIHAGRGGFILPEAEGPPGFDPEQ